MYTQKVNIDFVKELKSGKEWAFRSIFLTYFEMLEVFAKTYVIDDETARDIVQEVFTKLWEKKSLLSEDVNIKAYLFQATRNNCLNHLKRVNVQLKYEKRALHDYHDLSLNYEALTQLDFDRISYDELQHAIDRTVKNLPLRCREVFELSRYDGMKNKEIAQQLNISLKAVEGHITKALKELKSSLKTFYSSTLYFLFLSTKRS